MLLEHLDSTLQEVCRLERRLIVVGVSGGADSLCLMHALIQLGYPVLVGHLDHSLRPESADEAQIVQRLANEWGAVVVCSREDVAAYARRNRESIEEAARTLRYRFLFRLAQEREAQAVAVAHTADDQVETVLMHLLRGAGLSGLRGMTYRSLPNPWSRTIPLVRPLLGIWREEILHYLEQYKLHATLDASNLDVTYYRNRLRHEALPYLEKLNPGVRQRLWKTAELLREEEELIEAITVEAWQACALIVEDKAIAFDADRLRQQPLAMQRRLIRRAIARLRPSLRNIDFDSIERALSFLRLPPRSGQMDLISNLRLEREGKRLWLAEHDAALPGADWPQIQPGVELWLDIPGEVELAAGWRLRAEVCDNTPQRFDQALANPDPYQAWLDRETLQSPLLIRRRRPGDRFRPLGMGGRSLKLSDFMINVGLPRRARDGWPLALSGEEIAWLPGYRPGERFALRKETEKIVLLTLKADK